MVENIPFIAYGKGVRQVLGNGVTVIGNEQGALLQERM
jgi:hypothetical protein